MEANLASPLGKPPANPRGIGTKLGAQILLLINGTVKCRRFADLHTTSEKFAIRNSGVGADAHQ